MPMQSPGDQKPGKTMTLKRTVSLEADLGQLPGLQPCKIRRNYLCKECDYATTNPREFLYHQRDSHNQKGSIHECPYCVYASPHSHKLNRHVNIIHSPSRSQQLAPTKSQPTPPPPQKQQQQQFPSTSERRTATEPPTTKRSRPTLPQGPPPPRLNRASALRSPPPLMRQVTLTTNGSPKLEVILLEEEEEEQEKAEEREEEEKGTGKDQDGGGLLAIGSTTSTLDCSVSLKKSIRQLLMEPVTTVVSPIPEPMPKLTGKPAKVLSPVRRPSNGVTFVKPPSTSSRLLRTPSLSQKSAAKVSLLHKEYSCSLCSFKSRSNIVVQQHEKVFHLKKKFFRCTKCNYVTNVRSRYTKHLRYHSMPYIKCNLCDFSTPYKWNLDRHLRYHLGGGASFGDQGIALGLLGGGCNDMLQDSAFKCERCSFLATSNQSLNMHVLNHHGGKPRPRRIESGLLVDNGESTMTDDSLKENEVVKRENDERDAMAGYDKGEEEDEEEEEEEEEAAKEGVELKTDKGGTDDCPTITASTSGSSIYTCSECEDRFSSVPLLDRHMYECHDIDNPRIPMKRTNPNAANRFRDTKNVVQCDVCSYKAKWVSEMVKHRRVHTQDKPYACLQCKFRTRWKGDMTRHVMRYHDGVGKVEQATGIATSTTTGSSTDNIDCLLDQSMTVGGEGELCIWSPEGNEQDIPLDLSLAGGDDDDVEGAAADDLLLEELEVDADHRGRRPPPRSRPPQSYSDHQASQNSIRLSGGKIVHKKYQCPHCNFLTPTPSRFHMHIVAHINPKPFMCSECGYRSNWQWDITKHSKMKSIRDRAHLSASVVCVNEYGSSNYERYEQYAVYDMENSIADDVDGNKDDLHGDARTATGAASSSSRRITYKCKHCDFKNPVKKMVVRHMVVHSSTKQKRFCCGVCGHASHWKYIVLRHCHHVHGTSGPILLKDSSPASPPTSEDVHKATSSKNDGEIGDVDSHERSALNNRAEQLGGGGDLGHLPKDDVSVADAKDDKDKRHKCSICPYRCRKVFDLRIHSYLHRPREGAVFKCFFCPFYVSLKRSWLNHMRLHVDQPQDYAKQLLGSDAVENADSAACSSAAMNSEVDVVQSVIARDDVGDDESPNSGGGGDNPEGVPRVWVNRGGAVQKMFKCRHCPHVSKKRSVIVTHEGMHRKRNVDAGKATYKCPHCNYTSKNAGVLTSHQKVHQGENTVHSYVADKVHGDNQSESLSMSIDSSSTMMSVSTTMEDGRLKMRIKKTDGGGNTSSGVAHAPSTSEKLIKTYHPCGECPAKFTKLRQMLTHRTFHGAALPWQCDHCSYAAKHRPHLHRHERVHTTEYLVSFEPPLSEREPQTTVGGDDDDDDDDDVHDGDGDDDVDARSMQAATAVEVNAVAHMNKFVERKYRCQMCPAVFLKYSTLVYHMHLHNNNGKYQCTHCTYSVSNVGNLARHTKIHGSTIRIVDNSLLDLSQPPFRDHLTVASSSSSVASARPAAAAAAAASGHRPVKRCKGRFACDKCPAIFDKQVRYNVHINLHGSAHRFHCDKCDYAVKFAAILIRHKALHDNEDTNVDSSSTSSLVEFSSPYVVGGKPPPVIQVIRTPASSIAATTTNSSTTSTTTTMMMTTKTVTPLAPLESADGASTSDFGFTSFERQQQLLQLLQSKQQPAAATTTTTSVNEAAAAAAVDRVSELKKLFCCDRCPYVHQRKDAVQSHLKRHMSTARADASFCPHCDYGTTIHSFLREHMKLHFKPSVHHRPEGFVRMEDFEVWAQSNLWKTLVYEHRVHGKQFCEEDVIELSVADLLEKLKLKTEANEVASVVFELLNQVESAVVDKDRSSAQAEKQRDAIVRTNDSIVVPQSASASRSRQSISKVSSVATNPQTLRVFGCMAAGSSSQAMARQLFSFSEPSPSPDKCTEEVDFLEFALSLGFSA